MTLLQRLAQLEARQPPPAPPIPPLSLEEREARVLAILARLPEGDDDAAWGRVLSRLRTNGREGRR